MYNRYIPSQQGPFTRIPEEPQEAGPVSDLPEHNAPPAEPAAGHSSFLTSLLDRLGLGKMDRGDFLLLLILFLLFSEGEHQDEELLTALGLLLIL